MYQGVLPLAYVLLQKNSNQLWGHVSNSWRTWMRSIYCHARLWEICWSCTIFSVWSTCTSKILLYHLTQSTWGCIQTLGLVNLYQDNEDFRLFCRQLDALTLLPLEEVRKAMLHLRDIAPAEANPLVEYFDIKYVSGQLCLRNAAHQNNDHPVVRFRCVPPLFEPAKWNVYAASLQGEPRTNSMSEGFNNKFFSLVGHQHPSIWKLIECLKAEIARVTDLFVQLERGVRPKNRTKRVYVELQPRLKNLCEDRVEGRKSVAEFLRAVSHYIRAGQPYI